MPANRFVVAAQRIIVPSLRRIRTSLLVSKQSAASYLAVRALLGVTCVIMLEFLLFHAKVGGVEVVFGVHGLELLLAVHGVQAGLT